MINLRIEQIDKECIVKNLHGVILGRFKTKEQASKFTKDFYLIYQEALKNHKTR